MGDNKKILLVDDQIMIQELLADILRNNMYQVDVCANGHEAQAQVQRKSYDLVITDLRMPNGNGYDLLDFIEQRSEDTGSKQSVMIITGGPPREAPEDMSERGAIKYHTLHKPFTKQDFLDGVEQAFVA